MLPGLPAALQPHLTQQKQNVPAGSNMCANFMLASLDSPLLVSEEMSRSNVHPKGVCGEEHYICIRKGTAERRGASSAVLGRGQDHGTWLVLVSS